MTDVHFDVGTLSSSANEVTAMQGATAITMVFIEKYGGYFLNEGKINYEELKTFITEVKNTLHSA